jgi:hypothetical protein
MVHESKTTAVLPKRSSMGKPEGTPDRKAQKNLLEAALSSLLPRLSSGALEAWTGLAPSLTVLPANEAFELALRGLVEFLACAEAAGSLAEVCLPSKAVDLAWRALQMGDEIALAKLCATHFPRVSSSEVTLLSPAPSDDGLARCFYLSCALERLELFSGSLPLMFVLDHKLGLPNGTLLLTCRIYNRTNMFSLQACGRCEWPSPRRAFTFAKWTRKATRPIGSGF